MKKTSFILSATLLAFAANSHAVTLTWDGGGDGVAWTDGNNWDANTAPAAASPYDDILFSATDPGLVTIAASGSAQTLTLDNATLSISSSLPLLGDLSYEVTP